TPIIDCARGIADLAYASDMEFKLLGKASPSPKIQLAWIETRLSWMKKNGSAYWFLSHPRARDDVWATLAVLPMREEKIFRLLEGEMALQDVTSDDVLAPEQSPFSCYMEAVVRTDHEDSLL